MKSKMRSIRLAAEIFASPILVTAVIVALMIGPTTNHNNPPRKNESAHLLKESSAKGVKPNPGNHKS